MRGSAGLPRTVGNERKRPQAPAAPVRNLAGLAALFGEGAEGKWRGGRGLLIGVARGRNGHALTRIEGWKVTAARA
jgi:hypothetical protein